MIELNTPSTPLWSKEQRPDARTVRRPWLEVPLHLSPACAAAWKEAYDTDPDRCFSSYWSMDATSLEGVFRTMRYVASSPELSGATRLYYFTTELRPVRRHKKRKCPSNEQPFVREAR